MTRPDVSRPRIARGRAQPPEAPRPAPRRHTLVWREILVGVIAGVIVSLASVGSQAIIDDNRSNREAAAAVKLAHDADVREDLRFIRERSLLQGAERPFGNMNLEGQNLRNLILREADLIETNLREADMVGADLHGSRLRAADLHGASLMFADLSEADLASADLSSANLSGADLRGAYMFDADFTDVVFDPTFGTACFDEYTVWPTMFSLYSDYPFADGVGLECEVKKDIFKRKPLPDPALAKLLVLPETTLQDRLFRFLVN
jgi:hypothetical protein